MIKVNQATREIFLYDMIGPEWMGADSSSTLAEALSLLGAGDISLRINSPGGDVFEGYAMYSQLTRHNGKVTTYNDGLVASAATYPFLAGEERYVSQMSMIMIHEASTFVGGNAADLLKAADLLDKINEQMAEFYASKSNRDVETIKQQMTDETWIKPDEAKEMGFATGDGASVQAETRIVPRGLYKHTPASYLKPESRLALQKVQAKSAADEERKEKLFRLTGVDLRVK